MIEFRKIIRELDLADNFDPSHDIRKSILTDFKRSGGNHLRWEKKDLLKMCVSITAEEDKIEFLKSSVNRERARLTLKKIRRIIETYLFP